MISEKKIQAERERLDSERAARAAEEKRRSQKERQEARESVARLIAAEDLDSAAHVAYRAGILKEIPPKYLRRVAERFTTLTYHTSSATLKIGVAIAKRLGDKELRKLAEQNLEYARDREHNEAAIHAMTDGMC